MQQNTGKDSSQQQKDSITVNPITGNFEIQVSDGTSIVNIDSNNMTTELSYQTKDYQEKFDEKRQALEDMMADGDGYTKKEVRDLVLTANKAVWQESKDGGD
jgi:hypothetical protein